jgi:transcriptional regulator with XRE-family HTH domain
VRTVGRAFPDIAKLRRALELRAWTLADLAEKADISYSAAQRTVAGKAVAPDTVEAISRALLANPASSTSTGAFVLDEAAS